MVISNHDYLLAVFGREAEAVGLFAVAQPDWEPAREAAWLRALRAGRLSGAEPYFDVRLAPVWHATLGAPWVEGFRAVPQLNGRGADCAVVLPCAIMKRYAAQAAATLIERKLLPPLTLYQYLVKAVPHERRKPAGPAQPPDGVQLAPLALRAGSLAELGARSVPLGAQAAGDFRVFVPEHVLEEVSDQTNLAGEMETGSILLGQLCRDEETRDIFLEITTQVPARHTSASPTRLTFTAATWTAARGAAALGGPGTLQAGWFHSHPQRHWGAKCSERCPPEKRAACPLAGAAFLSQDDVALHAAIFGRAFCVALLVTATARGLRYAMFGWRQGTVQQRGFELIAERNPARYLPVAGDRAIVGEDCHDPT